MKQCVLSMSLIYVSAGSSTDFSLYTFPVQLSESWLSPNEVTRDVLVLCVLIDFSKRNILQKTLEGVCVVFLVMKKSLADSLIIYQIDFKRKYASVHFGVLIDVCSLQSNSKVHCFSDNNHVYYKYRELCYLNEWARIQRREDLKFRISIANFG